MAKNTKAYSPQKLLEGIAGYLIWASANETDNITKLANVTHDIFAYLKDGRQDWFSPRTERYVKYLKTQN